MARTFDGTDDIITLSAGAAAALTRNATRTLGFIYKPTDTTDGSIIRLQESGGGYALQTNVHGGFIYVGSSDGFAECDSAATSENWQLIVISKATGNTAPRYHQYVYDTGSWTHTDEAAWTDSGSTAVSEIWIGAFDGSQFRGMELAVCAVWDRTLTDTEVEQLAFSLQGWHASAPVGLWLFDQQAVGTAVNDVTGGGANQTAITGTAVSSESVPNFSYGHGILISRTPTGATITGTAALTLAGPTATIIGTPTTFGTAAVTLSGPTATIAGTVTPPAGTVTGVLSGVLGALTATMRGTIVGEATGSWYQLLNILKEPLEQPRFESCPNDGEPFRTGPNGELFCPFDGYQPGR